MRRLEFWPHLQRKRRFKYIGLALAVLAIAVLGLWRTPTLAQTARHYTDLELGPPPEVQWPDYTRFETSNGIVVFLLEDHEFPLVSGTAMFHAGERLEPIDEAGLASIVGQVMRSGGTVNHPADDLNQRLEQRAASVETFMDATSGNASFSSLTEDLDEVFSLFAEVIRQPAFPQDKIDLAKNQRRGAIARRNDNPDDVVEREFQKLVYGPESPYARTVEYATLDNISRDDLLRFYQQYIHPNNMILGIVGDFDSDEMRSQIEARFGDWQPDPTVAERIHLPEVSQARAGVFLVDQPQLTQSYIHVGHLGGRVDNPDYAAMTLVNEVMNGFGGRLVNEVRSRQGLAYVVYAYWSPRFDYPGLLIGGGQTRSETTVPFIQSTLAEIEKIRTAPITEEELARAKDSVLNAFIFNFQEPGQILSRLMRYEYFDYPKDFIFQYRQAVQAATIAEVQQAAQEHLKPENMIVLVVGNAAAIQPPLSTLGNDVQVTPIDITIPQPSVPSGKV